MEINKKLNQKYCFSKSKITEHTCIRPANEHVRCVEQSKVSFGIENYQEHKQMERKTIQLYT
jgi:hypothetical protein